MPHSRVNPKRIRSLNSQKVQSGPVVYWMRRDQRLSDNWALLHAQDLALEMGQPLIIVFNLLPDFLGATLRQFDFMLTGLQELEKKAKARNIPFVLLSGKPEKMIATFCKVHRVGVVVTDFSPLRIAQAWNKKILSPLPCAAFEVDTHNVVPVWETAPKQEYAARTIRPKIHKKLTEFLTDFPTVKKMPEFAQKFDRTDWDKMRKSLRCDDTVKPVTWIVPGENAAHKRLETFLTTKLSQYTESRNDPTRDGLSDLSPYFHFGQLSAQRVALETQSNDSYFEELVVRRELSDNFCFYTADYDSVKGFPQWAQKTLNKHAADRREYLYTLDQLEQARTHDPAWNAAQIQMVRTGKMHGYMRMYWAKKILEWSPSVAEALACAIKLNDRYELDGRDPNGYAGVAWAIGGVHDRPWFERPVFGTVRYMNYNGLKRKFDVQKYIEKYTQ